MASNPRLLAPMSNLGDLYRRRRLFDSALKVLSEYVEFKSIFSIVSKRFCRAVELFQSDEDRVVLFNNIGYTYLEMDRLDEAQSFFKRAKKIAEERDLTLQGLIDANIRVIESKIESLHE